MQAESSKYLVLALYAQGLEVECGPFVCNHIFNAASIWLADNKCWAPDDTWNDMQATERLNQFFERKGYSDIYQRHGAAACGTRKGMINDFGLSITQRSLINERGKFSIYQQVVYAGLIFSEPNAVWTPKIEGVFCTNY